jgi:hypothetical protein
MSWTKYTLFCVISLSIAIAVLELFSFGLFFIHDKSKDSEVFAVRDFTYPVDDSRFYSMKKDFSIVNMEACETKIETNELGTRVPPHLKAESFNKILFIGDSVPFGWCVEAEASIPFKFSKLRPDLSVINGAIPSYSLAQTVQRLKVEFEQIEDVKLIYLQIYDPAGSYARMGNEWISHDNWHSAIERQSQLCDYFPIGSIMLKTYFGNLINILNRRLLKNGCFFPSSKESELRFEKHIENQLSLVMQYADHKDAAVIVAPVTPPPKAWKTLPDAYVRSIKLLNQTLRESAKILEFEFLDTNKFLNDEDFIDLCCHLSDGGAAKVAAALDKLLQQ